MWLNTCFKNLNLVVHPIRIHDIAKVGGKNASLGEMYTQLTKKGINVPNGFATTAEAFNLFLKEADRLGCEFVATGHYVRSKEGKLLKGIDTNKDQSYFLWAIDPAVVNRIIFPIGDMTKPEVRDIARELGLENAEKKDSVGICFVGEVNMAEFLLSRLPEDPGPIVTIDGKVIGEHRGINFYTLGQRHGLDVGGGTPYYVVEKRAETKELVVSSNYHPSLYKQTLTASRVNWFVPISAPTHCQARIRYRQTVQDCTIKELHDDRVQVEFDEKQRAVTPGQSIVFYDGDVMLGGAIID